MGTGSIGKEGSAGVSEQPKPSSYFVVGTGRVGGTVGFGFDDDPQGLMDESRPVELPDNQKHVLPSGATRSGSIPERYDLMSPIAMTRRAIVYGEGAKTHGDRNWEKGMPLSVSVNRAIRHLVLYLAGDTSEDHLAHASVNMDFAMHMEATEWNDIPTRTKEREPCDDL